MRASTWDLRFIHLAEHYSTWSKDPSTKCGAVIVAPDRTIVSVGYNGFPRGIEDTDERLNNREVKYELVVHAEMNAVLNSNASMVGCTIYIWPFLSCPRCAMHLIQAGIIRCVAPRVSEEKIDRWGPPIARTREYLEEAGVSYSEIDLKRSSVFKEHDALEGIREILEEGLSG